MIHGLLFTPQTGVRGEGGGHPLPHGPRDPRDREAALAQPGAAVERIWHI